MMQLSVTSKFRNNERSNEDAKQGLKHVIPKANGALAISLFRFDFLVRFVSRQNEQKIKKHKI